jgi:ribosomal protein L21E
MWSEVGERTFFGPAAIVEAEENVAKIRENLKIAQSRQKSYIDPKRREVSFEVGDHVYLKVSPLRGMKRFHIRGKLSPRYVGPYPIVNRVGKVAYQLELPPELTEVHPVFHVSHLRKCVVVEKRVPAQALDV